MSRLAQVFAALKREKRTALVPYITAGDPDRHASVPLLHELVRAGADVLELGVPFSDPSADGPVIQQACERALAAGTTLADVLAMVRAFRADDTQTPVVLMGYLNPMEAFGIERFVTQAAMAGVDGVLTVDMPPEEAEPLAGLLRAAGLDPIFLLAPTTSGQRIRRVCEAASGFVYYVSLKGVTGAASLDLEAVSERLAGIRSQTTLPLGVGFGVRDAQTAARLAPLADAVIVGSAIVTRIAAQRDDRERMLSDVNEFVSGLRKAMDAA
ncbi:MAG TPA: tryptophan synthase subunit alpha [Gammaproteobacteria bacterium]|nr:tryptophan synthase subunit alpha [Gammaproteobacteria bacterium]